MDRQHYEDEHDALWKAVEDIRREMFGHDGTNGMRGRIIRIETTMGTLRALVFLAIPIAAILTSVALKVFGG
jgi:hypothetical protein